MPYEPTEWKNREVEKPRTFIMQDNGDGTITLIPEEGNVAEPGTPIAATFMNKIEQGIVNAIPKDEKGKPNGVPTLDSSGKVPSVQLNVTQPPAASTNVAGIVQLNDSLTSPSTSQAATTNAVKKVNDKLESNITKIGKDAVAFSSNTVSVGNNSETYGDGSIAIGAYARAQANNVVVIGKGTTATGNNMGKIGPDHLSSLSDRITFWQVNGDFYVADGTKNFVMQHPHPNKKDTHLLRHAAVESPTAGDNLYRYTVEATEDMQVVEIELPDYFMFLNKDVDVHVSPYNHFGAAYGTNEGNVLKVTCQKVGTYKVMIIGTRNDDAVKGWEEIGTVQDLGLTWEGETAVIEDAEIVTETEIIEEAIV